MKKNNFDALRICLALIVVFAHTSDLTRSSAFAWFRIIFDSNFAVKGFFATSGFLVTKSYLSSPDVRRYAKKRLRRIYPAYVAAITLCVLIGACATVLPLEKFLASAQLLKYVVANLLFLNAIQPNLPGVFDMQPVRAMNGALWTIKVELMLYCCVPPMMFLFRRFGVRKAALGLFLFSVAYAYYFAYAYPGNAGPEIARQFPGQLAYFLIGSILFVDKRLFGKLKWIAGASAISLVLVNNEFARLFIDPIAYGSIVIYLGTSAIRSLNVGRYGDFSYGLYLFHFPIIQFLISRGAYSANPLAAFCISLVAVFLFAIGSWRLIESKMLLRSAETVSDRAGTLGT